MYSAGLRSQNPRNSPAIPVVLFSQIDLIHETFNPHLCEFIFARALRGEMEAVVGPQNFVVSSFQANPFGGEK
jgi:hypothetical protein